jgi:hypothetical protein
MTLGLGMMWWPEYGDQSLFVVGAQQLREGSIYYRDFWDIKQPGLYWFYELGDLLLPGGAGTRLLEVALVVVAGLLALSITATWPLRRWIWAGVPTLVLAPYLIWSYLDGVGQIEGLMNVLILAVIRLTWPPSSPPGPPAGVTRARPAGFLSPRGFRSAAQVTPAWAWFLAGVVVGVVAVLKTLYVPIVVAPLAAACLMGTRPALRTQAGRVAVSALGAALPIAAACWYLAEHDVLHLALRTTFEFPQQVAANLHPAFAELTRAMENMIPVTAPLAVIALAGARKRNTLIRDGALAVIVLLELVLVYPQLWTPYRFLMLAAPMGLLAVTGLESVVAWFAAQTRREWRVWALGTAGTLLAFGLTALTLRMPAHLLLTAGQHQWGLGSAARIERSETPANLRAAALVSTEVNPGEQIYVVGDPSIIALLHAQQGLELTGWSLEQMPASVWNEAARELARSRPKLVYVDDTTQDWTELRQTQGRPFFDYLDTQYRVRSTTADGTWYEATKTGTPLPAPDGNQL